MEFEWPIHDPVGKNITTCQFAEVSSSSPQVPLLQNLDMPEPIYCDENRIAQLFSNLLSNAFVHGSATTPIKVRGITEHGKFILSVTNAGNKIPTAAIDYLFQPFTRADFRPGQQGLGLGLYISSEIAAAHRGKLEVVSTDEETTFAFRMPLQ